MSAGESGKPIGGHDGFGAGELVKNGQRRLGQERLRGDGEAAVGHPDIRAPAHLPIEQLGVRARGHHELLGTVTLVGDHSQVHVEDHPEQPVAAQGQREQLGVLSARATNDAAVGQQDAEGLDAGRDGRLSALPSVAVDADRPAHGEVVVRLHHRHGPAMLVQHVQDLEPSRPRTRAHDPGSLVESDVAEGQHVDHDAVAGDGVPTHAVPGAGDRDGNVRGGSAEDEVPELCLGRGRIGRDGPDLEDGSRVEAARIVDGARGRRLPLVHVLDAHARQMEDGPAEQERQSDQHRLRHAKGDTSPAGSHARTLSHQTRSSDFGRRAVGVPGSDADCVEARGWDKDTGADVIDLNLVP